MALSVALNLLWLGDRAGGIGTYVRELLPALVEGGEVELHVVGSRDLPADLRRAEWAGEVRWDILPVRSASRAALAAQLTALPALALARGADVVHGPANVAPVRVPRLPSVVTLHDLVFLHEGAQWEGGRAASLAARLWLFCARNADRVLAVSEWAAEDLARTAGLDRSRIDAVLHGVRQVAEPTPAGELRARLKLGEAPVILSVAQKRPYKGHATLIRALASLGDVGAVLVLPGARTSYEDELRALASSLGVEERVRFPDWVSDADLEGLYRLASAFALASRHEGFGLPVLEAMRCGTPVATSDRTALPEVAGDAALLFDPENPAQAATALRGILADASLASDLAARGLDRARRFTWARTAAGTVESYRRAIEARR